MNRFPVTQTVYSHGAVKAALLCIGLLLLSSLSTVLAQTPEHPAITRSVTGVEESGYDRPHLPPFQTSADGRIAVSMKNLGGGRNFFLLKPEGLASHFADSPDGVTILDLSNRYNMSEGSLHGEIGGLVHVALWDRSEVPGEQPNPYSIGDGKDYYDLVIIACARQDPDTDYITIWKTNIVVTVANPKTDTAFIEDITVTSMAGSPPFQAKNMFEPQISNDGKLVIGRIANQTHSWTDPVTQITHGPMYADVVYSYSPTGDPADWDAVMPLSHAPYDTRINQQYGFAMHPFRDPEGNIIPDNTDIKGTYPWMSRDASLVGYTVVGSLLHDSGVARYPNTPLPGELDDITGEAGGKTRGQIIMGLWTRGKMVLMDNVLNGTDYGLQVGDAKQRLVTLYEANSGPLGTETGIIRVGSGRQAGRGRWPAKVSTNTTFFDSLESMMAYDGNLKVRTPFDVVWRVSNGRATQEFAFDDYSHLDAFIISPMSGALTFGTANTGNVNMEYHDGWDSSSDTFSNPVKFANDACSTADRWALPASGAAFGNMRLEPVALGGIRGKGAWVDGNSGITYSIPAQPQNVGDSDWYVSVFADCRFSDDGTDRLLFSFPDQTSVQLRGRSHVVYQDAAGSDAAIINLPVTLPEKAWSHLAVQVLNGGYQIEFYLNGLLYHRWTNPIQNLFQMVPGDLSLAKIDGGSEAGFRGWLDEFKVFADSMNPETAANHAGGTIVGFNSDYTGPLTSQANLYPEWAHAEISAFLANQGEPTFDYYANWADYSDDGAAHLLNIPVDVVSLRHNILFPEGPIYHDAPRPQSTQNKFCQTCHSTSSLDGLALAALDLDTFSNAADDFRRQPSQQPRQVGGNIPANWLPGSPAGATDLGLSGTFFDPWLLPALANTTLEVTTFTLVDANTGIELMEIEDGTVLDYGKLGGANVNIVANVNSAQGSVVFNFAGDSNYHTANAPPYQLFGSAGEGLLLVLGDLAAGSHTLTASPYTGLGGGGSSGTPKTITFTVADLVMVPQADSIADFQTGTPATGWAYLTNIGAEIGTEANYVHLAAGTNNYIDSSNSAERTNTGGRPGVGVNHGQTYDGYSISSFQVSLEGQYYLKNTRIEQTNKTGGNGTNVQILVNDDLIYSFDNPATSESTFDTNLGYLKPGDDIYVAVGPKGHRGHDKFALEFTVAHAELTVVADYRDDFQGVSPKHGWQYLWNANGPIGDESGYIAMNWDGNNRYDSDAVVGLPDATEFSWGRFQNGGLICPGDGAKGSIAHDRCAIAAYSVRVAGDYVIADSIIDQRNNSGDGTEVFVYVNDTLIHQIANGTNQTSDFDCSLGYLSPGDTIYVAIGPNNDNGSDAANLDFSILVDPPE